MKNWKMVEKVQKMRPGWRFSLLGGDIQMGYRTNKDGSLKRNRKRDLVVVEDSRLPFGWQAEFFGEMDPRTNYGERHATGRGWTAEDAIEAACSEAMKVIKANK